MTEQERKILTELLNGKIKNNSDLDRAMSGLDPASQNLFKKSFGESETYRNQVKSAISSLKGGLSNVASFALQSGTRFATSAFQDQQQNNRLIGIGTIEKLATEMISNKLNVLSQFGTLLKTGVDVALDIFENAFKREKDLLETFAKQAGVLGYVAKDFSKSIDDITPKARSLGIEFEEIVEATSTMIVNSEKFSNYQGDTIFNALKVSAAYGETAKSLLYSVESFRNVGISLKDATEDIEDIGKKSFEQGLIAKSTTKTVIENLGKLNDYGFDKGVKGLSNMVMQAQALKFDMNETFKIAEKVFSPEGAIEVAGNLQVLGGAFGDLMDPIKMLYDSRNNVESLQSSYLEAAKSLATYNDEQQRFEVTGANLGRARAMADALGTSVNQLTSAAIKGRVQMEAMSEIELFDLTDDQKKFVSNLSSMQGGVLGIELSKDLAEKMNLKEGFVEFSRLSSSQMGKIADIQSKIKTKTTEDLIRDQYNIATQTLNSINSIAMSVGNFSRDKIKETDTYKSMVAKFEEMNKSAETITPDEINKKYNDLVNELINNDLVQTVKSVIDGGKKIIQNVTPKAEQALGAIEKIGSNVKEGINRIVHDVNLTIGVNVKNTNKDLTNMVLDTLSNNADAKKAFIDSLGIGDSTKQYYNVQNKKQ